MLLRAACHVWKLRPWIASSSPGASKFVVSLDGCAVRFSVKVYGNLTIRRFGSTASESFVDFLSFDFFALGFLGFCVLEPGGTILPDLAVVYVWWVKPVEAVGNGTEN